MKITVFDNCTPGTFSPGNEFGSTSGRRTEDLKRILHKLQLLYNNSKEERRACYEKLVNFRMKQGQDPDDYAFKLLEDRGHFHEMER